MRGIFIYILTLKYNMLDACCSKLDKIKGSKTYDSFKVKYDSLLLNTSWM